MARSIGSLVVMMTTVGLGCGPVLGNPSDTDDDGTGESGSTTGTSEMSGASGGQDQTGADETTTDSTGMEDTGDEPSPGLCGAREPSLPLAILSSPATAELLRADGSTVELDVEAQAVPPDASAYLSIDARGAYVAISLTWTLFQDGVHHGSEVSLFDADGARLWHVSEPDAEVGNLHIGAGGSVVATRVDDGGLYEGVLYEGGLPLVLSSFQPQAGMRGDGLVPGRDLDGGPGTLGWLSTDDLSFVALTFDPVDQWSRLDEGGDYVYVTTDQPVPSLVLESPAGAQVTALWEVELPAGHSIHVASTSSAEWLLLHGQEDDPWFRVSVDAGIAEPLDLTPPPGLAWLECHFLDPVIDGSGRILLPARDAFAGTMHRLEPDPGSWEPVAAPVTSIDMMSAQVYGQTTVVRSEGVNTTFCPPQAFEPAPELLAGALWQLERGGLEHVVPADAGWISVTSDGTCAAIIGSARGETTLLDLVEGSEHGIPGSHVVSWWHHP